MKFRKGDTVSVVGTVKYDIDGTEERVFITVDGTSNDLWLSPNLLTLLNTRKEVGDRVTWDGDAENSGEILAISEGHAWIDRGGGMYATRLLTSIDRAPETEETET